MECNIAGMYISILGINFSLNSRHAVGDSSEYLGVLVSCVRGSGSRCGSFSLQLAEKSLWIFPEDLNKRECKNGKGFEGKNIYLIKTFRSAYRCQCQQMLVSLLDQNGFVWICPVVKEREESETENNIERKWDVVLLLWCSLTKRDELSFLRVLHCRTLP